MTRDRLRLEIEPLPDARPAAPDQWQKLRNFLKRLLRSHGWRCVKIEPVESDNEANMSSRNESA